jgi:hypothetical protein
MKRLSRSYRKLESLNLFAVLQPGGGAGLYDPTNRSSFLAQVDAGLDQAVQSQSTLHGVRVQQLFESMVASFRSVKLLKQEDAGDCYGEDIAVPDYRVITSSGECLLIEVKNHYSSDPIRPFRLRKRYLGWLDAYASMMKTPLRVAIYWARWNSWTLNDPSRFKSEGKYAEIDFPTAQKENCMVDLGDHMLGMKYPLEMRMIADPARPRRLAPDGHTSFTIGSVELSCAGKVIRDKVCQGIAFYSMLWGDWEYSGATAEVDNGELVSVCHIVEPMGENRKEDFAMIGFVSSMFSRFYNSLTLADGRVTTLKRFEDPTKLGPSIPPDYQSEELPLWRFQIRPNLK